MQIQSDALKHSCIRKNAAGAAIIGWILHNEIGAFIFVSIALYFNLKKITTPTNIGRKICMILFFIPIFIVPALVLNLRLQTKRGFSRFSIID